jgi:hypothetical protein
MLTVHATADLDCDGPDGTGCRAPPERLIGKDADCQSLSHTHRCVETCRAEIKQAADKIGWVKGPGSPGRERWLCPACAFMFGKRVKPSVGPSST